MERIFASPSRYIQGKGMLKDGLKYIKSLGTTALIITDADVWEIAGNDLFETMKENDMKPIKEIFGGEASAKEIKRIGKKAEKEDIEVVVALGGGKTIDTGKAVADDFELPLAVLPTIASTDAPTSALSVIYSDEGNFEKYRFYDKNPDLVLVDTEVIVNAPAELLASGIADALATLIEARAVAQKHGTTMAGGTQTSAAMAIAEKCEEVIFENALKAIEANKAQLLPKPLNRLLKLTHY